VVTANLPATGPKLVNDPLLATARRGHLMASHGVDAIACRPSAASLLAYVAAAARIWATRRDPGPGPPTRQGRTDRRKCAQAAVGLVALLIGEGVELGEVVDVLAAVLVPEIMEAALLAC
jgi:hypothetical protein